MAQQTWGFKKCKITEEPPKLYDLFCFRENSELLKWIWMSEDLLKSLRNLKFIFIGNDRKEIVINS